MQKTVFSLLAMVILLSLPKVVSAQVNVHISGNASGSQSSVSVNSNVNSSSYSSSNTSTVENHVVVESNGERKEYHGSDPNVTVESTNGNNKVTINGKTTPASPKPSATTSSSAVIINDISVDVNATNSASPAASINPEVIKQASEQIEKETETFLERVRNIITHLFDNLF